MKLSKIALGLVAAASIVATATPAMAKEGGTWTLDYRHRFEDVSKRHFDRLCVIGAFDNGISFYIDQAFKSGSDKAGGPESDQWGDFTTHATEMMVGWTYKFQGTGFSIQPGLVTESTPNTTAYKPFVRVQYNTDFGAWVAVRGRYDYARNDYAKEVKNSQGQVIGYTPVQDNKTVRGDLWLGYNYGNFGINYDFTYYHSLDEDYAGKNRKMQNNKSWGIEHEVTASYTIGQWKPYIQVANLADPYVGNKTSDRQTRYAVGVAYTF